MLGFCGVAFTDLLDVNGKYSEKITDYYDTGYSSCINNPSCFLSKKIIIRNSSYRGLRGHYDRNHNPNYTPSNNKDKPKGKTPKITSIFDAAEGINQRWSDVQKNDLIKACVKSTIMDGVGFDFKKMGNLSLLHKIYNLVCIYIHIHEYILYVSDQ